jgi:hypothetical protein
MDWTLAEKYFSVFFQKCFGRGFRLAFHQNTNILQHFSCNILTTLFTSKVYRSGWRAESNGYVSPGAGFALK